MHNVVRASAVHGTIIDPNSFHACSCSCENVYKEARHQGLGYHKSAKLGKGAWQYTIARNGINVPGKDILWDALAIFLPAQAVPSHIPHFVWKRFPDSTQYGIDQLVEFMWPEKYREKFFGLNSDKLLTVYLSSTGVMLKETCF